MNKYTRFFVVFLLLAFWTNKSFSNDDEVSRWDNLFKDPYISVGASYIYMDDRRSTSGLLLRAGTRNVNVWASHDEDTLQILGQNMNGFKVFGAGVGAEGYLKKDISWFVDFGMCKVTINPNQIVEDEVVHKLLENVHGTPPFHADNYTYKLDKTNFCASGGLSYDFSSRLKISGGYRWLRLTQRIDMWEGPLSERKLGGPNGHWEMNDVRNADSAFITLSMKVWPWW